MALGAVVNTGKVPTIIPSGLKYFKQHEFRSRCIIEYGRPFKPSQKMIDLYKQGEKKKAVTLFLNELKERMHEVTITAPSYHELKAIYMARNLYLPSNITGYS
jgi:glycerol-3-phosphate O-acyltransferase/dihydroxyacetone phosphate acyltransferase